MAGLDGTIKVPALGDVKKKTALLVGGGAVAVAGVVYFRNRKASSDAGTSTDLSASDQSGTDSGIDPATGIPYAEEGGSAGIDPATGIPYAEETALGGGFGDIGGEIDPNTGVPFADEIGGGNGNIGTGGATGNIATKEQWIQQAEGDLNAPLLPHAAAQIFAGLAVTSAEKNVFLEAVGVEGEPPGGYPTPIKLKDTPAQPQPKPKPPSPGPKSPGNPHGKTKTIHADGHFDLSGVARNHGLSEARLLELNPGLRHLEGTKHNVPKGTPVKIPA